MAVFSDIEVWVDPVSRTGPENMAVDECLFIQGLGLPLLRFYQWSRPEVSFGYFEKLSDAQRDFTGGELSYVRRWTGGGIVDHRVDQTYTLFLPKGHVVEQLRGNESYRVVHRALADALECCGIASQLTEESSDTDTRCCFVNPVPFDVLSPTGKKLAGAGQKRAKFGLLHQGSVQGVTNVKAWQAAFVKALAEKWTKKDIDSCALVHVSDLVQMKYGTSEWMHKRL